MIDLSIEHLNSVKTILKKHVPDHQVMIFGSRANQTAKKHSDLDLCLIGDQPLSLKQMGILREAFSDSSLPFRVDLVDWITTDPEFKAIIEKQSVQIFP